MVKEQIRHKILDVLYEAPLHPSRWEEFLRLVALAINGQAAALLLHFDNAHSLVAKQWGLDIRESPRYEKHYYTVDVWAKATQIASNWIGPSEKLIPSSDLKRTEFYNDFLTVQGISHGLFAVLEQAPSRLANLSIFRGARAGLFDEEELALVQFLTPHIKRAYRLQSELARSQEKSTGLLAALDLLSTAIIVLGSRMQILVMNRAAELMMAAKDGLEITKDGLRANLTDESSKLHKLIAAAVATSNGKGLDSGGAVKISRRNPPPLHVIVSPVRDLNLDSFEPPRAIIFVSDPALPVRPANDTLRSIFGLTPAECRVAFLLSDGHAPRAIAQMIGVTENTVRSQIKSIYGKAGVKRQSELVRLLLNHAQPSIQRDSDSLFHGS